MNPQSLINPAVDLFLYDLRDGLGQEARRTDLTRRQFWRKFDPELDAQLKQLAEVNPLTEQTKLEVSGEISLAFRQKLEELAGRENPEIDFVELDRQKFAGTESDAHPEGYYCALQLGDTYALRVSVSDAEKRPVERFKELKKLAVSQINHHSDSTELDDKKQGTLGQTWLVWGELADSSQNSRKVAEECFKQLTPNPNWTPDFRATGSLAGATVFEYWHAPANWLQPWDIFSRDHYHLIICLFPFSELTADRLEQKRASLYFDFTKLFSYRHKILWAYWSSRLLKNELKTRAQKINETVASLEAIHSPNLNLTDLQKALTQSLPSLSAYAGDLNRLEGHSRALEINLKNYQKRLHKLETDAKISLGIMKDFAQTAEERYWQQLEIERASLKSLLTQLANLAVPIRSAIEIEQTKAARELNLTAAIASTGIAVSAVTATAIAAGQPPPKNTALTHSPAFLWGIAPIALAMLTLVTLRLISR
ncbi:hypothetical protein [Kamptonema formosum]|uniref:hypothetical protein n=1 Tax=Kamptonema formosum TaxID=331992 RepID=UPI00034DE8C4|nr:hypothetical protein [Oscillatoria sp. PCC 10802]